jgi:hypothetical protein
MKFRKSTYSGNGDNRIHLAVTGTQHAEIPSIDSGVSWARSA